MDSGVVDSSCVMVEEMINITYCGNNGVFIPSKVIDLEEEGDKVLHWVLSHLPYVNAWTINWYRWENEKFLESGLVGDYGVVKVLSLNTTLLTCGQCVIH